METLQTTMARQLAEAASAFQRQMTGHVPQSVTVVLGVDTLVITLYGALSPAEKALAQSAAGAAQVQEFHRQLFASSSDDFRRKIQQITGVAVQEAAAEILPATGAVVHAFTTGTMVQVYHFATPRSGDLAASTTARHVNHADVRSTLVPAELVFIPQQKEDLPCSRQPPAIQP